MLPEDAIIVADELRRHTPMTWNTLPEMSLIGHKNYVILVIHPRYPSHIGWRTIHSPNVYWTTLGHNHIGSKDSKLCCVAGKSKGCPLTTCTTCACKCECPWIHSFQTVPWVRSKGHCMWLFHSSSYLIMFQVGAFWVGWHFLKWLECKPHILMNVPKTLAGAFLTQ